MRTRWVREVSVTVGGRTAPEVGYVDTALRFAEDPGDREAGREIVLRRHQRALLEAGIGQCVVADEAAHPVSRESLRERHDGFGSRITAAGRIVRGPAGRGKGRVHAVVVIVVAPVGE